MEQILSWEANQSLQVVKKFPAFYGTQRFFTVLTTVHQLSLSWANSIQSPQPPPTSWRSILILSSHLRLGLLNGLFPSGFPTNTLCTPLSSPIKFSWHSKLNQRIWGDDFPCNKKESKFIQFAVTGFKISVGEHKKDSEYKATQIYTNEIKQYMKTTEI
jgi:hypothetical protein